MDYIVDAGLCIMDYIVDPVLCIMDYIVDAGLCIMYYIVGAGLYIMDYIADAGLCNLLSCGYSCARADTSSPLRCVCPAGYTLNGDDTTCDGQ
jgi:hypothetical protein